MVEDEPLPLDGLELDGLDEEPLALEGLELDGLELLLPEPELMPLDEELEPEAPVCPACHSL